MRRILEAYRWMWGAIRRWRGGPLWRRTLLFLLYVLRDLFGTGRRTALAAGTVAALLLGALLLPRAPDLIGPHVEPLDVSTAGAVRFRGRWMNPSDLGPVLDRFRVRRADVAIEADASFRVVDDVQRVMVESGVRVVRVRLAESF